MVRGPDERECTFYFFLLMLCSVPYHHVVDIVFPFLFTDLSCAPTAQTSIWEKKFGSNANHKKKEMEEKVAAEVAASNRNRNRGHKSDINTGSNAIPSRNVTSTQGPPGATVPPRGRSVPQGDSGWSGRTKSVGAQSHSNAKPLAPKSDKTDNKALHPSWEAKRRLKEKESVGIVPSQGTKIKFT